MYRVRNFGVILITIAACSAGPVSADECTPPSDGPDVIAFTVSSHRVWGVVGDVSAHSIGTEMCNVGDEPLPWELGIAQNAYRLSNNRFEQIGMSWIKKAIEVLGYDTCCPCISTGDIRIMGVGCSDAYHAITNGAQSNLGPRSSINVFQGFVPDPSGQPGSNAIDRRMQIRVADLNPALNAGAMYFGEIQLVTPDDAQYNSFNNISYSPFNVVFLPSAGTWGFSDTFTTLTRRPAIQAWAAHDPTVTVSEVDVPDEGRLYLGHRTSDNGDGTWHYEYALFNQNSHRSARRLSIPVPSGVTIRNIGFHDVDHHSGEPYDVSDWPGVHAGGEVRWATESFDANPNANALRWSTLYNFRFDANSPPAPAAIDIELFLPGTPQLVIAQSVGPTYLVPVLSAAGLTLLAGLFMAVGACFTFRIRARKCRLDWHCAPDDRRPVGLTMAFRKPASGSFRLKLRVSEVKSRSS